jgi:hypothetical protein
VVDSGEGEVVKSAWPGVLRVEGVEVMVRL